MQTMQEQLHTLCCCLHPVTVWLHLVFNHVRVSAVAVAVQVAGGSTVALPHLSLLEVASLPLLFMVNSMAVQRAVARSAHLAM
jgi:hypothetical protein